MHVLAKNACSTYPYSLDLKDSSKSIVKNHNWEAGASAYFWFDYIRLRKYSNGICSKDANFYINRKIRKT